MPKTPIKKPSSAQSRLSYLGKPMPHKSELEALAMDNSTKHFPGYSVFGGASEDRHIRKQHAQTLRERRAKDKTWVVFGSSLPEVNKFFRMDLAHEVSKMRSQIRSDGALHLLELGCGDGQVSVELSKLPGVQVHATNLTIPDSQKTKLADHIDWKLVESVNIDKKFKQRSMKFIFSHFGLDHERFFDKALPKVLDLLDIGGKIVFNTTNPEVILRPPANFVELRPSFRSYNAEKYVSGIVYYWERIK